MKKIEFHYSYFIIAIGFILTGYILNLIVFSSIIIIHELGHYLMAKYQKQEVKKIIIYPYGGLTKLNSKINLDINKELMIATSGIILQSIYYIIIYLLFNVGIVREYTYNLFTMYHYAILLFNLLPIIPLDGSKILNLILSKYLNFKLSNRLNVIISFLTIVIVLVGQYYQFNYVLLMVLTILVDSIIKYYQNLDYLYHRFLLERYLYNFNYSKIKVIKNKDKMYKNYKHIFKTNDKYLTEKRYLRKMFDLK